MKRKVRRGIGKIISKFKEDMKFQSVSVEKAQESDERVFLYAGSILKIKTPKKRK